jgi:hypothetical protein
VKPTGPAPQQQEWWVTVMSQHFFSFVPWSGASWYCLAYCAGPGRVWTNSWDENRRGHRSARREPVPVPLCPPQIPRHLMWARTSAAAAEGQHLTAWAMTRP